MRRIFNKVEVGRSGTGSSYDHLEGRYFQYRIPEFQSGTHWIFEGASDNGTTLKQFSSEDGSESKRYESTPIHRSGRCILCTCMRVVAFLAGLAMSIATTAKGLRDAPAYYKSLDNCLSPEQVYARTIPLTAMSRFSIAINPTW
jgi:hypothetical protein